jgi:integrase
LGKLTAVSVKTVKKIGLHGDGGGLYLKVQKSADPANPSKSWMFRWGAGGKNTMGLGSLRDISLSEARALADAAHKQVAKNLDPRREREKERAAATTAGLTFAEAAEKFIESRRHEWKNVKHQQQWKNTLDKYAEPIIGKLRCADVTHENVLSILSPIWSEKHETATRLRGRIESVLDWASAMGLREGENPARWKGKLEHLLPTVSKRRRVKHHEAMPYAEVPHYAQTLRKDVSVSAKALLFCILTATRTSEIINSEWSEIDLMKRLWTIPKGRMKREIEHRVPLSEQIVELLESLPRSTESNYIFVSAWSKAGKPLSNMAMLNLLKSSDERKTLTVHGFRSSFRDWAGETTEHRREVIEQALAHSLADQAEAAYQRGDYLEKRRLLMNDWADYCIRSESLVQSA